MSEELKPCPFCGSDEQAIRLDDNSRYVMCLKCSARGPAAEKTVYYSRYGATSFWNLAPRKEGETK
ncbi:MAG: Lar family restriction alleviation protein [Patescibacteria group bacterium]|nr:Lar family restriction alleviation protein [Patescibacteria group bacterium]